MARKVKIRINSSARTTSNGNVRVRTTISNGHSSKTTTKTIRVKQFLFRPLLPQRAVFPFYFSK